MKERTHENCRPERSGRAQPQLHENRDPSHKSIVENLLLKTKN
jgi:hypothetical protein